MLLWKSGVLDVWWPLHTTTSKNVFTRPRKLFCLIDHHLSTKGRWCLLDLIGLFVSTYFNVRAFPNTLPHPTSTRENFFTPFLQDCSQPIANTWHHYAAIITLLLWQIFSHPLARERACQDIPQTLDSGYIVARMKPEAAWVKNDTYVDCRVTCTALRAYCQITYTTHVVAYAL